GLDAGPRPRSPPAPRWWRARSARFGGPIDRAVDVAEEVLVEWSLPQDREHVLSRHPCASVRERHELGNGSAVHCDTESLTGLDFGEHAANFVSQLPLGDLPHRFLERPLPALHATTVADCRTVSRSPR